MAQDVSVVVDDRPGVLVRVGEATPGAGVKPRRWVDAFETAPAAV
jgi:hypothetical protein